MCVRDEESKMIELTEASKYANRRLSVFDRNLSLPRHRWYMFKEGFSEELVGEAIEDASGDSSRLNILDPFAGSGTIFPAATRTGCIATGIEIEEEYYHVCLERINE